MTQGFLKAKPCFLLYIISVFKKQNAHPKVSGKQAAPCLKLYVNQA
jgi:hypothetical protein